MFADARGGRAALRDASASQVVVPSVREGAGQGARPPEGSGQGERAHRCHGLTPFVEVADEDGKIALLVAKCEIQSPNFPGQMENILRSDGEPTVVQVQSAIKEKKALQPTAE